MTGRSSASSTPGSPSLEPIATILVTGGLGFIGSAVIRRLLAKSDHKVVNLDKHSYASTEGSVESAVASADPGRYRFFRCDLADAVAVQNVVTETSPSAVLHLAAESHVDRSIDGPRAFLDSNIVGTFNLLEAVRSHGSVQRFVHVSTDEVFGSLGRKDPAFDEATAYDPRSPYSATKAASDHLARAWGETYGLPVSVTNCSNNYGPYQFPEKLIPLMTIKALRQEPLPVYGRGENIRDWLHVEDHAAALLAVLAHGEASRTYAIGGDSEVSNLEVVGQICDLVDAASGDQGRRSLIEFVSDRPGHDLRYGVDASRIKAELGWAPTHSFGSGLAATVDWFLANEDWWGPLLGESGGGARRGLQEAC